MHTEIERPSSSAGPSVTLKTRLIQIDEIDQLSMNQVHELYRDYINATRVDLMKTFGFGNDLAQKAEGVWITLKDGRRILDFTGGVGVLNHGHNHPRILEVRRRFAADHRMEVHKNYFSQYLAALSHNLAAIMPGDLKYSFFPNSGSESVDGAMKTAYKYHDMKRPWLLHSDLSFHGKLLGPASVTHSPENHYAYPKVPNTKMFKYDDIESLKKAIEETRLPNGKCGVAGILYEPMNVSNMKISSEAFLRELREICDREDIVLIFDEVYSGWGKTGYLFNFMRVPGLLPDVLCMAKSFGGGKASISGLVTREKVFRKSFETPSSVNLQSSTFYGFGEETVTAIEAINIIVEDDYVGRSQRIGAKLREGLTALQNKHSSIKRIEGSGALFGVFLDCGPEFLNTLINLLPGELFRDPRFLKKLVTSAVISEMYDTGGILSLTSLGEDIHLIVAPSLVVNDEEIDLFLRKLDETLAKGVFKIVTKFAKRKFGGA